MALTRRYLEAARVPEPVVRRLRILAFDPSLATRIATASFNEITVAIPWEELEPGPVGEYIEVVDVDPASGVFYYPVELDDSHLLARDGHPPSESNPQFHQQMVYAVAMTTIQHFERALGRKALWADRRVRRATGKYDRQFVRRLRIYPHALRDRNAYYSPSKKALLFGYFPVASKDQDNTPGTIVFTCLSYDIIAHETTHALLDGVHPRFNEATNRDVPAFHEAFADIVALFQHFTYPAVLESQIRRTRGDLDSESLLGQLAQQFGRATGRGAALRDALGSRDEETGKWTPRPPNPHALDSTLGAHDRGAILVAAVFRAFLLIYRARTVDLFRIATQGTGTLPEGEIHPDLTARLAQEAARSADRVLQMCIRAIDYCPPVHITFGAFLRGVITADLDFSPEDRESRIVFIESFREWGIYPTGISSMGVDALAWPTGEELIKELMADGSVTHKPDALRRDLGQFVRQASSQWNLESDRFAVWKNLARLRGALHDWLLGGDSFGRDYARIFGLEIDPLEAPSTVARAWKRPAVEVHAVRPTIRRTARGMTSADLVIEITQRRDGYYDKDEQERMEALPANGGRNRTRPDFYYRAGATILVDPATGEVRRVIRTPGTIADTPELDKVRDYLRGEAGLRNAFDGEAPSLRRRDYGAREEPFALLHQLEDGP